VRSGPWSRGVERCTIYASRHMEYVGGHVLVAGFALGRSLAVRNNINVKIRVMTIATICLWSPRFLPLLRLFYMRTCCRNTSQNGHTHCGKTGVLDITTS
jgi:hypothetical protein